MRLKSPMPKLIPDLSLVLTRMNVAITRVLAGYVSRYSLCRMLQLMFETVSIVRQRCLSDFFFVLILNSSYLVLATRPAVHGARLYAPPNCLPSITHEVACGRSPALLAHHFLHVSMIRVKSLTLRLLMSYIYIYGEPILDVSR